MSGAAVVLEPWQHDWGKCRYVDRVWAQVAGMHPRAAGSRLILALNLQAFFDESVDAGGAVAVVGYLASAAEWAAFSKGWKRLLPAMGTLRKDGAYHFKMSEMALLKERMERVPAFHTTIHEHARASIAAIVHPADMQSALDRLYTIPPTLIMWSGEAYSPYFMALRLALDRLQQVRIERPELAPPDEPISVYFDANSEEVRVREVWARYMRQRHPNSVLNMLRGPYFERDDEFLPLQAADFRAWWFREWALGLGVDGLRKSFESGDGLYPFKTSARKVFNSIVIANEDFLAGTYREWAAQLNPHVVFGDRGPTAPPPEVYSRDDPPWPAERLWGWLKSRFRKPRA